MSDELFDPQTDPAADPDPLAGGPAPVDEDPFAEVEHGAEEPPVAAEEEELPPGVQPGSLAGVNPSEEAERLAAEAEAAAEAAGEEATEPPIEPDADEALEPEGEFGLEEQDREAVADDPPEEPTDQEVSTPLTTGVEDNRTPVAPSENGSESQTDDPPDPLADPVDPPQDDPAPAQDPAKGEPPASNGNGVESKEKKATPKRRRRAGKQVGPGQRLYTILRLDTTRVEDESETLWMEEFEVVARSTELALRQAYRKLSDNSEANFVLIATPSKYFKPTPVKGKVPEAALTIKVG